MGAELALTVPAEMVALVEDRFTDDDKAALDGLTPRQRAFVLEYPMDFNATAAAERAGYSGGSVSSFAVTGSRLLRHPRVNPLIRKLTQATADEMGITREWLLKEIKDVSAELRENGQDPTRTLALLGKLRGDMVERVQQDVRVVQIQLNDVDMEDLR